MKKNLIITSFVLSLTTAGLFAADTAPTVSVNIPADPTPPAVSAPATQAAPAAKAGKHKAKKHKKHLKKTEEKKPETK